MNRIKKFNEGWNPFTKKKEVKKSEIKTPTLTPLEYFLDDLETDNFKIAKTEYNYLIHFIDDKLPINSIFGHGSIIAAKIKKTTSGPTILVIDTYKYEEIGVNKGYRVKVPSLKRAMDYMEELESKLKKHNEDEDNKFDVELKD